MTITPANLYWITRCDNIRNFMITMIILSIVVIIGCFCNIAYHSELGEKETPKFVYKIIYTNIVIFFISVFGIVLMPKTSEMCAFYVIPKININDQKIINDGGDVLIDNTILWLTELKKGK